MNKGIKVIQRYNNYFEVQSKVGIPVGTTKNYWDVIIRVKHPTMKGKEAQVKETLCNSDEVRVSKKDISVLLFYKRTEKRYICVVVRFFKTRGFIITAY